jgi:cytochrome o ubiquinol oxidase subunit II
MNKKYKVALIILLALAAVLLAVFFMLTKNVAVLNPKGVIALKERELMITATLMMLIVVIPVFILTFVFAWRYRANNTKTKYTPEWDHHRVIETIWWGLPFVIILILAVIAWRSSHELDPFKPLDTDQRPMTIQVVALQWKWLFIYPEQNIATVNFVQFPEQIPIHFEITADAPMNSFWIPQLGGQVYAMPGMKTQLHLIANEAGSFRGSSANLSGKGFAGMTFTAKAGSQEEFLQWVQSVKQSPNLLSLDEYNQLVEPSINNPVATYLLTAENLYDEIVMKYMMPPR